MEAKQEEVKKTFTQEEVEKLVTAERDRIAILIASSQTRMALDYKNTIKHTGGLLTTSMVYAYSKSFNDITKLILNTKKEEKNEKSV